MRRMSRAVLTTGCPRGIGGATAVALAAGGWPVYAAVRRPETLIPQPVTASARLLLALRRAFPDRAREAFVVPQSLRSRALRG